MQNEIKEARILESENAKLQSTIQNYKESFDVVTKKFKQHDAMLNHLNQIESTSKPTNKLDINRHVYLQNKLNGMILALEMATQSDGTKIEQQQNEERRLKQDSEQLKQLLLYKNM